jgi:hypothetical protein
MTSDSNVSSNCLVGKEGEGRTVKETREETREQGRRDVKEGRRDVKEGRK